MLARQTSNNVTLSSRRYRDVTALITYTKTDVNKGKIIICFHDILGYEDTIEQTDYSEYQFNGKTYTCRYTVEMILIEALRKVYLVNLIKKFPNLN